MTTIKQKQQMVLDYIQNCTQTPLCFKRAIPVQYGQPSIPPVLQPILNAGSKTLKDLVYAILENCIHFGSYEPESTRFETSYGRMRSSLDIWRHVIYYRPDVDIFSVMEVLYQLRNDLYGHYCSTVHRTVFKIPSPWQTYSFTHNPKGFYTHEYRSSAIGVQNVLKFSGWKKLHYKGEKKYE